MVVYYRGPGIVVTNRQIENDEGCYRIRDLHVINRIQVYTHPARTAALVAAAVEVALAAPMSAAYGSIPLLCTGFVSALGIAAAVLVDHRRNPRWMALLAFHHGQEITLFSSRDQQEFGKVRRAVLRAVEANFSPYSQS
ncbi:DUF6232 family protein [Dactylosporangium sp. NPDC049525]|uniref:DUF6232 family protein n=1 Tax=Dactylosporangium sp. NPDC049525 TaxID=3154730 RepID=UPI00343BAEE7